MLANVSLIFLLTLVVIINSSNSALCPPPATIPCICNTTIREISCRGGFINISDVFDVLTKFIPEVDRDFDSFYLNSRGVTTLEANTFKGIRFRTVLLGGSKLTYLHKDVFNGTHLYIKQLFAFATNLSVGDSDYNLFDSISSLQNLQRLVISGSNIAHIPDRAFRPRDETYTQRNLSEIELGLGAIASIKSIGFASFANLPALKSLSFSSQRIHHIKAFAFTFYQTSNKTLTIDLTGNNLSDDSFEVGAFLGANRPVKVYFGLNGCNKNITFLNETIFKPFFDENSQNAVDIGRSCNHMICDCRMDWILKDYEHKVRNLKCRDGLPIRKSKDRFNQIVSKCESKINNSIDDKELRIIEDYLIEENDIEVDFESNIEEKNVCLTTECFETASEMDKYLNKSINPCDNFYDYACGRWEDTHLLEYLTQLLNNGGVEYDNFVKLRQQIDMNLNTILSSEVEAKDLNIVKNTIQMYRNCKDNKFSARDLLMDILNQIGGWPIVTSLSDDYKWQNALVKILANIRRDVIITLDSTINIDSINQLKVSHTSFILSKSTLQDISRKSVLRDVSAYAKYIHDVAVLLGATESDLTNNDTLNAALDILKFESYLAKISEQSSGKDFLLERDLKSLKCLIPEVDWIEIFTNILRSHDLSLDEFSETNVVIDIHYMIRVSLLLQKTDPIIVANYLGWRVVETFGFLMGGSMFLEHQQTFHNIQSNEKTKDLWKQCLQPLKSSLPMLLTRKYAETYLTKSDKLEVIEIIKSVKHSFINLINDKEWLDDKKIDFIKKAETITENVGYPDWIFDDNQLLAYHQNLTIKTTESDRFQHFYTNLTSNSIKQFLMRIGEKVNKTRDWDSSPLLVGAFYDIIENIITIPIGLLHPPFYDRRRPKYLNFGSIGSFVGHEISHASMPRYDLEESLMQPWNEELLRIFLSKAKCFADQYSSYYDEESDMNLDGMKTFEEDIGDTVGLKASFNAYNNSIKQNENIINSDIKLLPNFSHYSPQQLFFLSYAQKWCRHITGLQVKIKILRGVHSPEKYRVNGALSNFDEFSKAFNCPSGSTMNPESKCELW